MPVVDIRGFQPDVAGNFAKGASFASNLQGIRQRSQNQDNQEQLRLLSGQVLSGGEGAQAAKQQLQQQFPAESLQLEKAQAQRSKALFDQQTTQQKQEIENFAKRSAFALTLQPEKQLQYLESEVAQGAAAGRDMSDTQEVIDAFKQSPDAGAEQLQRATKFGEQIGVLNLKSGSEATAGEREFESLTEGLDEKQVDEAKLIKLGLSPRAVGSAIQTISDKDIADEIGNAEATISQRKKFGEMTGSSRAKAIDKGFERIVKIDLGINNLDRALKALDDGASTGVLQKFSPSIRASSIELDQIRNTLALDVLNAATFGALSAEELKLVKETALPTALKPEALKNWLITRKSGEQKLRAYFQDQINWLETGGPEGKGGTVAGFLRMKEAQQDQKPEAGAAQTETQADTGDLSTEDQADLARLRALKAQQSGR